jgi:hypothetical protein
MPGNRMIFKLVSLIVSTLLFITEDEPQLNYSGISNIFGMFDTLTDNLDRTKL